MKEFYTSKTSSIVGVEVPKRHTIPTTIVSSKFLFFTINRLIFIFQMLKCSTKYVSKFQLRKVDAVTVAMNIVCFFFT
jgi:uncharacterized membrane protein